MDQQRPHVTPPQRKYPGVVCLKVVARLKDMQLVFAYVMKLFYGQLAKCSGVLVTVARLKNTQSHQSATSMQNKARGCAYLCRSYPCPGSIAMIAFLHPSPFCASFRSSWCCFRSLRTRPIHLSVGLPRGLFPPTFIVVTCFATFECLLFSSHGHTTKGVSGWLWWLAWPLRRSWTFHFWFGLSLFCPESILAFSSRLCASSSALLCVAPNTHCHNNYIKVGLMTVLYSLFFSFTGTFLSRQLSSKRRASSFKPPSRKWRRTAGTAFSQTSPGRWQRSSMQLDVYFIGCDASVIAGRKFRIGPLDLSHFSAWAFNTDPLIGSTVRLRQTN